MSNQSTRVCSLFSNASKSGGTYYSGKTQADITIPAGARLVLVKSTKTAANGSEIWSLMFDHPGADDANRVYGNRSHVDLDQHRGRPVEDYQRPLDDDRIPF